MRIAFVIQDDSFISNHLLESALILPGVETAGIFSQPVERASRLKPWLAYLRYGDSSHPRWKRRASHRHSIQWIQDINSPEDLKIIMAGEPEIVLLLGFPQIVSPPTLGVLPPVVNYHNSHLPAYRGKYATHRELLVGENSTGFTFHRVDADIDTGPILLQERVNLDREKSALLNEWKKTEAAARALPLLLKAISCGTQGNPQASGDASMGEAQFRTWLEALTDEGPMSQRRVIEVCGGCPLKLWDGQRHHVTALSSTGEPLAVKGLPIKLYRFLHRLGFVG